jgi:hypothetical protein
MSLSTRQAFVIALGAVASAALAQEGPSLTVGGTTYTKFLWGNQHEQGALYSFTTVPGEGWGDSGQGSELELLLNGRVSRQVEVKARLHSRFSQNHWTSFNGFGGTFDPAKGWQQCLGASCGEFDPRSNWYIKLRGVAVTITPGYLIDSATIGANDWGQFDPFVVGRIRYIDRDNMYGVLVQGSLLDKKLAWDLGRISLPKLWAGPNYNTGAFHALDASYVGQFRYVFNDQFDLSGLFNYVNDVEVKADDNNWDDGRDLRWRFRNGVGGLKAGIHISPQVDVRASAYYSYVNSMPDLDAPRDFAALTGFSPVPAGLHFDGAYKLDVAINDPLEMGLSLNIQAFSIGSDYVSVMAARREADVLLTEGHDGQFSFPGPANANFGVYPGNGTRIGYGGWSGTMAQVATINVDNEFSDFDEQAAETVIGWKGITVNPVYGSGSLDLSGEYSFITYNTNWQAWGDADRPVTASLFPSMEVDSGVGHNFRSAYSPFQDKNTHLIALNGKYVLDVFKGIDVFGKVKFIYETDKRLNNPRYLPYAPGDCPGNGQPCSNVKNFYSSGNTTADIYVNPDVVTNRDGAVGYAWAPFDDISDDDRELRYFTAALGAGYQFTDDLYLSLHYQKFLVDLLDGNTAFQSYGFHEMVTGFHDKNQIVLKAKYVLAGVEFGMEGQWTFGTFTPYTGDFGLFTEFVPQYADQARSSTLKVPEGSMGFPTRVGGWQRLDPRFFSQVRMKAFMKALF